MRERLNFMPKEFCLNDYIQAKYLLKQLHLDSSKALSLFKQAILDVNKTMIFNVLLNDFLLSIEDTYLLHMNTIGTMLRYSIQYNNIYAFRLISSLPRQDLILEYAIDFNKQETISMLAASYASIDVLNLSLRYYVPNTINTQNTLGETVLHYAIKNNNHFNKEKMIDYLLGIGADPHLPYTETVTVHAKILQIKEVGKKKVNFILCYQQHCLNRTDADIYPVARLSSDSIKNILGFF